MHSSSLKTILALTLHSHPLLHLSFNSAQFDHRSATGHELVQSLPLLPVDFPFLPFTFTDFDLTLLPLCSVFFLRRVPFFRPRSPRLLVLFVLKRASFQKTRKEVRLLLYNTQPHAQFTPAERKTNPIWVCTLLKFADEGMLIIHTLHVGGDVVPSSYDVSEETALAVAAVVAAADVPSAADVLISEIASKNHQPVHTRRKKSPGSLV